MQTIIVTLNSGKKEEYVKGIKVKEILNKMPREDREDAILIKYNNKKVVHSLLKEIKNIVEYTDIAQTLIDVFNSYGFSSVNLQLLDANIDKHIHL